MWLEQRSRGAGFTGVKADGHYWPWLQLWLGKLHPTAVWLSSPPSGLLHAFVKADFVFQRRCRPVVKHTYYQKLNNVNLQLNIIFLNSNKYSKFLPSWLFSTYYYYMLLRLFIFIFICMVEILQKDVLLCISSQLRGNKLLVWNWSWFTPQKLTSTKYQALSIV